MGKQAKQLKAKAKARKFSWTVRSDRRKGERAKIPTGCNCK